MEGGDGMAAVVKGRQDAALVVTVLDGCRRYTLMSNSAPHAPNYVHMARDVTESTPASAEVRAEPDLYCDSSVQATDGRYTSIYKTTHCNVSPTSPPVHLTEFPPQRAGLCPGYGSFEVGGTGSGETYTPVKPTTQFRGGMSWPDRGSVCAPRPSYEPDPFANSLRKYPNLSPQISTEIVERLINYTQARHASCKSPTRNKISPTRLSECNSSHALDKESRVLPTRHKSYEPEVNVRPRVKTDESPTREGRPKRSDICPESNGTVFCRNFEVRYLRDMSKKTRDSFGTLPGQNTTSVNMEIQAVVETISREVATLPREVPSKRNVAVSLSPISSITQCCPAAPFAASITDSVFKSVQTIATTIPTKIRKSVQATTSSIELLTAVDRWQHKEQSRRKTKSQEELRTRKDDFKKEMLQILKNIDCNGDDICRAYRDDLVRKIKKNRRKINLGIDGRAKSAPFWSKTTCRHCVDNCRKYKNVDGYRTGMRSIGVPNEDRLQNTVYNWLQEIHTNNSELLERHRLDHIVSSLAEKFRLVCLNSKYVTKSEIMQMIEEVTFDASDNDRNVQLKNLADALTEKIKGMLQSSAKELSRSNVKNTRKKHSKCCPFQKLIQPTKEEVKGFVREELLVFMNKFHLKFDSRNIRDVETEVIDILIDSIDELRWSDNNELKEEVATSLKDSNKLPDNYYNCLADTLVKRFKSFMCAFNAHHMVGAEQQTFVVFQNTVQNTSVQPNITDTGVNPVTEADVEAHIERYTSQLTQVIEAWWTSILGADDNEIGFRNVAINDLAGDIVDRHRFLDMNTSKRSSDEEEVEYLRFQIFRWINKLVSDKAMQQALDRAPELMEQIQQIPVPIMKKAEDLPRSQNLLEHPRSSPRRVASAKPGNSDNQLPTFVSAGRGEIIPEGSSKHGATGRRMSEPADNSLGPMSNDFENYLHHWVNLIPIVAQDKELTEKLRRRIYNGVLMALAKADLDFGASKNYFYQRTMLEEEVEDLLSCLPSSPELASKKLLLKTQLIEHATRRPKAISIADTSPSYKYRLWDAITSVLPSRPVVEDSDKTSAHLHEEFLKLNISEDYLLYKLYNDMNLPRANAHKEKVLITLRQLYDNAKLLPGSDRIVAVDAHTFADNIYNTMIHVSMPARDVLKDEGDQIIIGHEISQWMQGLPIAQSDTQSDQLQRRILRDSLAKKIHDIEKRTKLCDNSSVRQVKNVLSKFLEKFSPRPEEAGNLSFLIDEFTNRLKNRGKVVQEPVAFPWFFMNVPFSSSFVEHSAPIELTESIDEWRNLGPPEAAGPRTLGAAPIPKEPVYKDPTHTQWLTLLDTQEQLQREKDAHALAVQSQPQQSPLCCQPAAVVSLRSQAMNGSRSLGQNEQISYREPSNIQWLTLLNTQEQIEREKEVLEDQAKSKQIPSCCQPAIATSQLSYDAMGYKVFEPVVADSRGTYPSHVAGASYHPLPAPSMHTEMQRLVDLQDQRLSMMQGAIPSAPGPSGVTSFIQPQAQPISDTSQMPEPTDPYYRDTPMMQRPVRPRKIGSPQQVMSDDSPSNQTQFRFAAPLVHQEPVFATRHDLKEIPDLNISRPMMASMDLSIQEPVGFSTPRQSLASKNGAADGAAAGSVPWAPRARRKRTREGDTVRPDTARRRLDLMEVEEEEDRERDEMQCRCTERMYRCRRRRSMCCDCEDMDYPRFYSIPYPYCFF